MLSTRLRAAAAVAALFALAGLVGTAVFLAAREDASPPPTTTTTSTTSTTLGIAATTAAIADALTGALDVDLTRAEAGCIAGLLVDVVDVERLEDLARSDDSTSALSEEERDALVRGVVACLPPPKAAALLGSPTTTAPPASLPDEDL